MQEFPPEADQATVLILMSVVRADQQVLQAELDLVQSFFARRLKVSKERIAKIRSLLARYAVETIPEESLRDALEMLPESARHLLFSVALEVAVVDNRLEDSERNELLKIGHAFGLSDQEIQTRLLEVLKQQEDAFSLLGVEPEAEWHEIQAAYEAEKEKYSPTGLAKLGVAFQSLALERLERIEWAYQTLGAIYSPMVPSPAKPEPQEEATRRLSPSLDNSSFVYEDEEFLTESDPELWQRLPSILKLTWQGSERDWDILEKRLGFSGGSVPTLDELAQAHGIARERVRQIVNAGRRVVRALLLTGRCQSQTIHPRIVELCRSVFAAIQSAITEPVSLLDDFTGRLERELAWEVFSHSGLYPVIEEWLELTHAQILGRAFVFHTHSSREVRSFESAVESVHDYLQERGGRARAQQVREALYREVSALRCSPEDFFRLVPGVSLNPDGSVSLGDSGSRPQESKQAEEFAVQGEMTEGWSSESIGEVVENFFSRGFLTSVSFRVLGLHVQSATGVSFREASEILRKHPAVSRERVRGRLFASLRRNWRQEEALRREVSKPSVQELVDDFLRERLRGDLESSLRELLEELAKETGVSASALSEFVERSEHCRRFERGGQTWVTGVPQALNLGG